MGTHREAPMIQPFLEIHGGDSEQAIQEKFQAFFEQNIYSAVLQYAASAEKKQQNGGIYPFDEEYFDILKKMSRVCQKLGMTYWVQDAAPFPTGAANGAFRQPEYFEKGKLYIKECHTNVRGPVKDAVLLLENFAGLLTGGLQNILTELKRQGPELSNRPVLLGVVALPMEDPGKGQFRFDTARAMDLIGCADFSQGTLKFDLPEGIWRIFFLYETHNGNGRKFYMNLLDEESVAIQIREVHQLHYEKMKEELGVTWEGFFYDEPEIGNVDGYDFDCLPGYQEGQPSIILPWCKELPEQMKARLGREWMKLLPGLWYDCGQESRVVRYHYMDLVTRLVRENYNGQVQSWCRERGIRYIGHGLEDENSHARLGCGPGHFFRMQRHQDMAGIDLIGGQLRPGMDMAGIGWYGCADGDGEFYHYGLAKLASSEAHINPDKNGNSFCEVNAVYQELSNGRYYKFLLDHLFIRGINHLVPVLTDALTRQEGARLFSYGERMCHMLADSRPVIPIAVLYHGESEWSGDCMLFQRAGAMLARNQIDYDVIPADALTERDYYKTGIADGKLKINGNEYQALVIPWSQYLPKGVLHTALELYRAGGRVYFIDRLPEGYCEETGAIDWRGNELPVVPLPALAGMLREEGIFDIICGGFCPWLRYSHWQKDDRDYYMFLNEDDRNGLETTVTFQKSGSLFRIDVGKQWVQELGSIQADTRTVLSLGSLESAVYVVEQEKENENVEGSGKEAWIRVPEWNPKAPSLPWNMGPDDDRNSNDGWKVEYEGEEAGPKEMTLKILSDLGTMDGFQRYIGPLTYKTRIRFTNELPHLLDLGEVGDSAQVTLNGIDVGYEIAAPYRFDVSRAVKEGENELIVRVLPSRARQRKQTTGFDLGALASPVTYACMPRIGLMGPVAWQ